LEEDEKNEDDEYKHQEFAFNEINEEQFADGRKFTVIEAVQKFEQNIKLNEENA